MDGRASTSLTPQQCLFKAVGSYGENRGPVPRTPASSFPTFPFSASLPGPSHPCSPRSSPDLFVPFAEHSKLIHVFVKGTGCSQSGGQRAGFLGTPCLLATCPLPSVLSSKISFLVTSPLPGKCYSPLCIPHALLRHVLWT